MANFDLYFPILLKHEGGLVDDKDDPGGITNLGVSINFALSTIDIDADGYKDADVDMDGDVDADDIRKLTSDKSKKLYKLYFWDKIRGDQIKSQSIAEIVFDHAVNAGIKSTGLILQKALNSMFSEVVIDGQIGPKTIEFTNKTSGKILFDLIKQGRVDYYNNLVTKKPILKKFLKGWLNRVNSFKYN